MPFDQKTGEFYLSVRQRTAFENASRAAKEVVTANPVAKEVVTANPVTTDAERIVEGTAGLLEKYPPRPRPKPPIKKGPEAGGPPSSNGKAPPLRPPALMSLAAPTAGRPQQHAEVS